MKRSLTYLLLLLVTAPLLLAGCKKDEEEPAADAMAAATGVGTVIVGTDTNAVNVAYLTDMPEGSSIALYDACRTADLSGWSYRVSFDYKDTHPIAIGTYGASQNFGEERVKVEVGTPASEAGGFRYRVKELTPVSFSRTGSLLHISMSGTVFRISSAGDTLDSAPFGVEYDGDSHYKDYGGIY